MNPSIRISRGAGQGNPLSFFLILFFLAIPAILLGDQSIKLQLLSNVQSGVFDEGAAEITAFDPTSSRLFVVNAAAASVDILDISNPAAPVLTGTIDATAYGAGANSVAVKNGILAVAVEADPKQDPGVVVFFDSNGNFLNSVTVGALPDMLTFTPDGQTVLVANEGEPDDDYLIDPQGSVSIIDISAGIAAATVSTADFTAYDGQEASLRNQGIRIFGPNASASQDLEPEYIAVDANSQTAWVALQENNAFAIVDIATAAVTGIIPLGFKDYSLPRNSFDASNRDDGINIRNWPVLGMYMPDGIASYTVGGSTYIVCANEGDARDYDGFSEEERVGGLTLDPIAYPASEDFQNNANLGRLLSTTTLGDTDGDGDADQIYSFGARSFSIRDANGNLVYDSGNEFELLTSQILPNDFNSTNDENDSFDSRSDDKGPEPEGVDIGTFMGRTYAFIGLERIGGVMVYDISDPYAPFFVHYANNRNFSLIFDPDTVTPAELAEVGDLGPEGILFISEGDSPNGKALLVVSNEISGSVSIFQVNQQNDQTRPFCDIINVNPGPPVSIEVAVQDDESGIASIEVLKAKNAEVIIPEFVSGTTGRLMIIATKIDPAKGSTVVLRVTDRSGNVTVCDPVYTTLSSAIPEQFTLEQNYPNPFNPETTIRFALRGDELSNGSVSLRIYNIAGQLIRTLINEQMEPGTYSITWNGQNDSGQAVASGLYVYRLKAGDVVSTRTMNLIR